MPPNIEINWTKRFYSVTQNMYFDEEVQDHKDGVDCSLSNLTGCQEIKSSILVKFYILSHIFFFLGNISSLAPILVFLDNKASL